MSKKKKRKGGGPKSGRHLFTMKILSQGKKSKRKFKGLKSNRACGAGIQKDRGEGTEKLRSRESRPSRNSRQEKEGGLYRKDRPNPNQKTHNCTCHRRF